MKILAFEFSSSQRSVAFLQTARPHDNSAAEVVETGAVGAKAFEMAATVLRQAGAEREQVEVLALGLGPGSYTGIRGVLALAQGWELAQPVKLLGISSAECVAVQAQAQGTRGSFAVVIDAQRNEFYLGEYESSDAGLAELKPLRLATLPEVREVQERGSILIGPEVRKWFPQGQEVFPRAATLARLAGRRQDFVPGERLSPIYLRQTTFVKAPPSRIVPDQ